MPPLLRRIDDRRIERKGKVKRLGLEVTQRNTKPREALIEELGAKAKQLVFLAKRREMASIWPS